MAHAQVFNHEAQARVHRVVLLQLFVHRTGALPQARDFKLLRSDVFPQVTDFLVEDELKLLQLLRLLLQVKDVLLALVDNHILLVDLRFLVQAQAIQLVDLVLLFVKLRALLLDQAVELLDVLLHVSELVLGDLQVGLRAQAHVRDLVQACLIFLLDFSDLIGSILVDLLHRFAVVLFCESDLLGQIRNRFFLRRQGILMVFLLFIGLLSVLIVECGLSLAEPPRFLLLLLLQCLVLRRVLKHALRVLVATLLDLLVIFLGNLLELLLELVLNLGLARLQLLDLTPDHQLLARELLLQLLDLVIQIVGAGLFVYTRVTWIPGTCQFIQQAITLGVDLVHFTLFRQNLVAVEQRWVTNYSIDAGARVSVLDLVDHQTAVAARRKQPIVVMAEAHTFDGSTMGLDLRDVLDGELPDLDGTWAIRLTCAREECLAVREHLDCRNAILGVIPHRVVRRVVDLTLVAGDDGPAHVARHVRQALELLVAELKVVFLTPRLLELLLLEVVEGDLSLVAAVGEARVILVPVDVHDLAAVALAEELGRAIDRVEVEELCVRTISGSEHVTTVGEPDLVAVFHLKTVILVKRI